MNIQTGIAIVLAIVVVGVLLVFPGLSPFNLSSGSTAATPSLSLPIAGNQAPTELQVTDEVIGTGATVAAGDSITVNYTGMLADGTVFDASASHGGPATFAIGVGQVIPGWDQGMIGMKEGGKRRLVIPSALAYGSAGVPNVIPADATLTFEVELVKVTPAATN